MNLKGVGKYLTVWQSRIGLGLAFAGTIVVGLGPDHERYIDPEKLIACIVAGALWLGAELASAITQPSEHDIALFKRIQQSMDDDALTFLREHDFAVNFHSRQTSPVHMIAQWHGPNYVFIDKAIQERWTLLTAEIIELSNLYAKTLVGTDSPEMVTAWLLGYPRHEQPDHAKAEVQALNDAATTLYTNFGDFIVYARKRLNL